MKIQRMLNAFNRICKGIVECWCCKRCSIVSGCGPLLIGGRLTTPLFLANGIKGLKWRRLALEGSPDVDALTAHSLPRSFWSIHYLIIRNIFGSIDCPLLVSDWAALNSSIRTDSSSQRNFQQLFQVARLLSVHFWVDSN